MFHVLNRATRGTQLFETQNDYHAFGRILSEAVGRTNLRLLAYCLMSNHWHMVIWPTDDLQLSKCMHWLTLTHASRWTSFHAIRGSGAVYQSRYKAIPVETETSFLSVCRYVERNALRAGLVPRAEHWQWSSLWQRCNSCDAIPLHEWPVLRTGDWVERVNEPQTGPELEAIRKAVQRGEPIGTAAWKAQAAAQLGLSLRLRGRPKAPRPAGGKTAASLFGNE